MRRFCWTVAGQTWLTSGSINLLARHHVPVLHAARTLTPGEDGSLRHVHVAHLLCRWDQDPVDLQCLPFLIQCHLSLPCPSKMGHKLSWDRPTWENHRGCETMQNSSTADHLLILRRRLTIGPYFINISVFNKFFN